MRRGTKSAFASFIVPWSFRRKEDPKWVDGILNDKYTISSPVALIKRSFSVLLKVRGNKFPKLSKVHL